MLLRRFFCVLVLSLGCAPQSADRATLTDALDPPGATDARTSTAGVGGFAGMGGAGGVGGGSPVDAREAPPPPDVPPDRPIDRPLDRAPDTTPPQPPPPPDAAPTDDAAAGDASGEGLPASTVLMVVGDPAMPSPSDTRLRALLEERGTPVRIVDDSAAPEISDVAIVVLTGSCASATLAMKYRTVPVPVLNLEPAVQDDLGLTAATDADLGEQEMSSGLTVAMAMHPIAAGLTGNPGVVSTASSFGWGRPAAAAQRIALIQGMANRVAIYAYAKGAMMVGLVAPARRVGFFAADGSARYLGPNGVRLFNAALDWALTPEAP